MGAMPCYGELEHALGPGLFRLRGGRRGGCALTDMGWEVVPEGLNRVLVRLHRAYGLPLMVTENGLADATAAKSSTRARAGSKSTTFCASEMRAPGTADFRIR